MTGAVVLGVVLPLVLFAVVTVGVVLSLTFHVERDHEDRAWPSERGLR